jgi:hypothetical protein
MGQQTMLKVWDIAKKMEREITHAAYAAKGPKVYKKLGIVGQDGSLIQESPNQNPQVQQRASVRVAGPVAVSNPVVTAAQNAALDFISEETTKETEKLPEQPQASEKSKRGPKPGSKRNTNKSISSSAAADEK